MGQKSSVPIQTTVLSSNPAAPPVRKKPPAPLPPYRIHSFVIPENKVLPTGVAPRRLRPVSTEMARTNSDFASIWGNPVTALDEQIRDSLQKESLDRHAANLASIIAGVEAKHVPSKNDVSLPATSAPCSDPQRGQNPDANYQGTIEGLSSNSVPSKTQTLNSESSLGPKSEESSFRFQNQEKNLQNLSVSAKENVIRASSAPPSYKTNGEFLPNGGLPGENFPSGGLPLDFASHRRNPSTSTFSSQPIFIDESEENASFASDTFSRISNTSLPQRCSFNLDRTQSLTYAQLAESRRQNSPLSNLDLNSRSQLGLNHSSNRNGEIDFSVQSVDRRKSRKKKRAPDPPKGASPFSVSSHDEREERNILDVLPEQEPPGKPVWSQAETESEKCKNNSHAQVKVSEEEEEKPREAVSSLPKWYTASSSSPASSSSSASKLNVLGEPSLTYRNLITPVLFKTESAKSTASCVPARTTLESKSVDTPQLPPGTSSSTTPISTFTTTAFEPASTNAQPELDNGAQITNQPVLTENKPTVSLPEETTNITTTKELKTSSDVRLPDTTRAFKQITVDHPDFIEPSIELQRHHRNLPAPLASSESYEPKSNKDERLFQTQEPNDPSLPSATQDTSSIWKPPTQDDISMLLASSEKIQNNKTLENNLMKEKLGDFHGNLQPDSIYVKRSKPISKEENKQVNPIMEVLCQPPEVKNTTETPNAVNEQNVNPNPNPNPSNSQQQIEKIENELSSSSLNDLKTNSTFNETIVSTNNYLSSNVPSLANSVTTTSSPVNYISTSSPYGGGVVPSQSIPTSIVSTALPQTNSFLFNFATNQTVPLSQYIVSSSNGPTPYTLTTTPQVSNSQLGQQVTYPVLPHYNTLPATIQPNLPQLTLYSTATPLDPQVANLTKIPTLIVNPDGKVIAPLPPGAQLLPGFVPAVPMVSSQFPGTTQAQETLSETESVTLPRSASNLMANLTQQIQEVAKAKSQNESYHSPLLVNPVSNISSESGTSPSSTPQVPPPPPPPPPPPAPPLPPLEPSVSTSSFVSSGRDSPLAKVLMAAHKSGAASSATSRRSSNSTTDSDSVKGLQHIQREDILAARSSLRSRKDRVSKPVTRSQSDNPHEMFQKELNQVILVRKKKYNESPKSITVGRAVGDGEAVSDLPGLSNDNRTNSKDNSNPQMTIEPNSRGQSSNSSEIGSITSNSSVISNSSKLEKTSVSITQARTSPQNIKNTVWLTNIDVHRSRSLKEKEEKSWTPEQDLEDFEEKENGDGGANNGQGAFISSGFKANLVPGNIKQFCSGFQSGQTSSLKKNKTCENNEAVGEKTKKPLIVWESQDSLLDGSVSVSSNWSFKASDTSDLDAGSEKKSKKEGRKKEEVPAPDKKANRFSFPVAKTKENPEKRPLVQKKSAGIVYGSHGEIMFLPGFQNADNDENHVTDENAGNAPKWRSKKKKYAFQSTVKLNEKERLELELASRVQARERQMEEERLAQRRTELEFCKMRSYMCYPEERVSSTISSQVSSSSNEQSRTTTMESKAKQPVRKTQREFAVAGSDDGVILRQVTSIGDRKGKEVELGVKKANGEVEAPAKSKKRTSKQGNEPGQKVSNPGSKPISGFENASSNHPSKDKWKTGTKSNHPRTLNPNPPNHPNPGLLSNPPLGASLPNLAFFNDYLKLLSATQTIVPNLYQQNLNSAFFASNPNLINQVNPFYPFFVNPMSTGDTSGVFGGMAYNQSVPNGVQNPMYASDESDKDDDEDDTESIYQSIRQNRTDYTSSCSSDQGKDFDNSYSTQSSSVAYTSTECSRDRDDKSSDSGNILVSETEIISTQSSSISSIDR